MCFEPKIEPFLTKIAPNSKMVGHTTWSKSTVLRIGLIGATLLLLGKIGPKEAEISNLENDSAFTNMQFLPNFWGSLWPN